MSTFVHHELSTNDPSAAKKFYKGLFGWKFTDFKQADGSVYQMFTTDDKEGGGIQKNPMPGAPSAWLQYVGVKSVKKAMAKAVKLGGKSLLDFMPIPGHGAMGIFVDPTGAQCAVWEAGAPAKKTSKKTAKAAKKKPAMSKKK
jgi:predicted enzyme related to lactoylglutathione lyase